jgi:hypothetical protein
MRCQGQRSRDSFILFPDNTSQRHAAADGGSRHRNIGFKGGSSLVLVDRRIPALHGVRNNLCDPDPASLVHWIRLEKNTRVD